MADKIKISVNEFNMILFKKVKEDDEIGGWWSWYLCFWEVRMLDEIVLKMAKIGCFSIVKIISN